MRIEDKKFKSIKRVDKSIKQLSKYFNIFIYNKHINKNLQTLFKIHGALTVL